MYSSKLFPVICLSLTVFLTVSTVIAQEELPWPPDLNTLFTDAVEVISVEEVDHVYGYDLNSMPTCFDRSPDHQTYRPTNLATHQGHSVVIDHDTQEYFIYEGQNVESYDFPEGLARSVPVWDAPCRRTDGLIYITSSTDGGDERSYFSWFINEDDGSIQEPELICGSYLRDLPGEGRWVTVWLPDESKTDRRLCFTENGERTPPLPIAENNFGSLGMSPDQNWVVLTVSSRTQCDPLYSYNVKTGNLILLLVQDQNQSIGDFCSILEWVSDDQFLLYSRFQSMPHGKVLRLGNVTSSNSVEPLMGAEFLNVYDEYIPQHYEAVYGLRTDDDGTSVWTCEVRRFNRVTVVLETYELGDLCGRSVTSADDELIYFRVAGLDLNQRAVLAVYHFESGERTDLYTAEIEDITGISPDGRYLILLLDDNGRIDFVPFGDPLFDYTPTGNTELAIYDTLLQRIVYQFSMDGFVYHTQFRDAMQIDWFMENAFLISSPHPGGGGPPHGGEKFLRLVWPAEARHISPSPSHDYGLSPDTSLLYSIVHGTDEDRFADRQRIEVIDLETGIVRIIEAHEGPYETLVSWQDDQTLIVTVVPRDYFYDSPEEDFRQMPTAVRYTVRFVD